MFVQDKDTAARNVLERYSRTSLKSGVDYYKSNIMFHKEFDYKDCWFTEIDSDVVIDILDNQFRHILALDLSYGEDSNVIDPERVIFYFDGVAQHDRPHYGVSNGFMYISYPQEVTFTKCDVLYLVDERIILDYDVHSGKAYDIPEGSDLTLYGDGQILDNGTHYFSNNGVISFSPSYPFDEYLFMMIPITKEFELEGLDTPGIHIMTSRETLCTGLSIRADRSDGKTYFNECDFLSSRHVRSKQDHTFILHVQNPVGDKLGMIYEHSTLPFVYTDIPTVHPNIDTIDIAGRYDDSPKYISELAQDNADILVDYMDELYYGNKKHHSMVNVGISPDGTGKLINVVIDTLVHMSQGSDSLEDIVENGIWIGTWNTNLVPDKHMVILNSTPLLQVKSFLDTLNAGEFISILGHNVDKTSPGIMEVESRVKGTLFPLDHENIIYVAYHQIEVIYKNTSNLAMSESVAISAKPSYNETNTHYILSGERTDGCLVDFFFRGLLVNENSEKYDQYSISRVYLPKSKYNAPSDTIDHFTVVKRLPSSYAKNFYFTPENTGYVILDFDPTAVEEFTPYHNGVKSSWDTDLFKADFTHVNRNNQHYLFYNKECNHYDRVSVRHSHLKVNNTINLTGNKDQIVTDNGIIDLSAMFPLFYNKIEVFLDGHFLTPGIDYKIVSHSKIQISKDLDVLDTSTIEVIENDAPYVENAIATKHSFNDELRTLNPTLAAYMYNTTSVIPTYLRPPMRSLESIKKPAFFTTEMEHKQYNIGDDNTDAWVDSTFGDIKTAKGNIVINAANERIYPRKLRLGMAPLEDVYVNEEHLEMMLPIRASGDYRIWNGSQSEYTHFNELIPSTSMIVIKPEDFTNHLSGDMTEAYDKIKDLDINKEIAVTVACIINSATEPTDTELQAHTIQPINLLRRCRGEAPGSDTSVVHSVNIFSDIVDEHYMRAICELMRRDIVNRADNRLDSSIPNNNLYMLVYTCNNNDLGNLEGKLYCRPLYKYTGAKVVDIT